MGNARTHRQYDHRLKSLIRETGDIRVAIANGVPRSTARDWMQPTTSNVISLDVLSMTEEALRQEVLALRQQNARLLSILRLVVVLVKVYGISLARRRMPEAGKKELVLRAVERSRDVLSLRTALRLLGLSSSRYHTWKREEQCKLEDVSSCPHSFPHQLTVDEVATVKNMVTADEYRHVPTGTLALLAQRLGRVFASSSTWYRLVRLCRWGGWSSGPCWGFRRPRDQRAADSGGDRGRAKFWSPQRCGILVGVLSASRRMTIRSWGFVTIWDKRFHSFSGFRCPLLASHPLTWMR